MSATPCTTTTAASRQTLGRIRRKKIMLTILNYCRDCGVSKRVYRLAPPSLYIISTKTNCCCKFGSNICGVNYNFPSVLFCIFHSRYMGHFCGALAGFLVGLVLLENRKVRNIDIVCPDRHLRSDPLSSSRSRCGRWSWRWSRSVSTSLSFSLLSSGTW